MRFRPWRRRKRNNYHEDEQEEKQPYDDDNDNMYHIGTATYIFSSKSYPYFVINVHSMKFDIVTFDFGINCLRARRRIHDHLNGHYMLALGFLTL